MASTRLLCVSAFVAACLLVGCKPSARALETPGGNDSPPAETDPESTEAPVYPAGVSHSASIDRVALSPSGRAGLSRDTIGGLRLWPALDGSREPLPITVAAARSFALLETGDAFVVLAVEGSGGARFIAVRPDGSTDTVATLAPFNPVLEVHALAGGESGRFLVLMKDGSLRVFDPSGAELATFDEKGFQPASLRTSADGKHVLAVSTMDPVGSTSRAEVQRISLSDAGPGLELRRSGVPQIVQSSAGIMPTTVALSPDGSEVAVASAPLGNNWNLQLFDLAVDAEPKTIAVQFQAHQQPHIGYVAPASLLVSANDSTTSRLVDTESGEIRLRTSIPSDFSHQGRAQALGRGVQLVGYGTYVFVHDVSARTHRFLGYTATQGSGVGVSPSGSHVAWAYAQGPVVIETVDGSREDVSLDMGPNTFSGTKVRFVDEEHVLVLDSVGELSLVHWPSQTTVAHAGTMSNIRALHLDRDQGVCVIERHSNDAWVYELSIEGGFVGPYIVSDVSKMGIMRPAPPSDILLWTQLASGNKVRSYTLDQLRGDLTLEEMKSLTVELDVGRSSALAIDPLGQEYGVRWNGSSLELFVSKDQETLASAPLRSNEINQILPSPQGDRFLAVLNHQGVISAVMHDSKTAESLWSYASGEFSSDTSWSDDGRFVAISGGTGAVLLDAHTGKPVVSRCGLQFRAVSAPPSNAFAFNNQHSICEP